MESRVRKPDVVHLSLPIKLSEKREHTNSESIKLSLVDDWSARHAHPGHEVGCRLDPAQAHSLRILASPDNEVDGEAGLTSRPMYHIEATPSGQGPLVRAHFLRYHVARGSSSGGVGAQGRGPVESISPCCAIQSFHDCLLGESGVHVGQGQPLCKWVSPSAPFPSQRWGPKRLPPPSRSSPWFGLAHGN